MTPMLSRPDLERLTPDLKFLASVVIRLDAVQAVGDTPDGVRFDFNVRGTVDGPGLKGKFPASVAHLLIDADGIGTIHVRAPLLFNDGAMAELEATGRYDFGTDGHRRAIAGDLPDSALGWCPRFYSGHPRYTWLNRIQCLGVGELRPREARVDYDLYAIIPRESPAPEAIAVGPRTRSLYERLGGRDGIQRVFSGFIDALHENKQLNRQNPRIGAAAMRVNPDELKRKVVEYVCRITGGPCEYTGRPLKVAHDPLDISEADWSVGVEELVRLLNKYNVGKAEQDELLAAIGTTKPDIVKRSVTSRG